MSYGTPPPPGGYGPPPGGYSPPPGGYGGEPGWTYQSPPSPSAMAITSMVTGIVSLLGSCLCCGLGFVGIAGIVLGILGLREVRQSNGAKTGGGMAIAGIVTGALGLVISIAVIVLYLIFGTGNGFHFSTTSDF